MSALPDAHAEDIVARARDWLAQDPDPVTRAELEGLVAGAAAGDAEALAGLRSRFGARLAFGTAGLRGELGAGPNRMNRVLVAQAAAGFAAFLRERASGGRTPVVVVGYDGRTNSHVFARDSAELFAGAGLRAILLPRALPTPVLAFAVRHLDADGGVMVTASHNPPRDNGYKVYLGGADAGSQIVPPSDARIQERILAVGDVRELPRSPAYETAAESIVDAYVRRTAAASALGRAPVPDAAPLAVVYTAMHGVGWDTARRVLAEAGFPEPTVVAEQITPDPAFPTVAFPNPEEPGAMDLAFATAERTRADLVLANDPDADRLAVGVPDGEAGWRRMSGNEVGILLGWAAAKRAAATGGGTLAASLVSSPALAAIAREHGLGYAETLTGFKWISRVPGLVYGYEEALGYLVDPDVVRDKDGVSAAVAVLGLATAAHARGSDLAGELDAIAERIGAFASSQVSIRVSDLSLIPRMMERVRADPPTSIGGVPVERVDDLAAGFDGFPPSDLLRFVLAGAARVVVRPSGTEPKLKVYIDAASTKGPAAERRARASAIVASLDRAMRDLLA